MNNIGGLYSFQGSYGIVKLAYNEEDDTHYVSNVPNLKSTISKVYI